MLKVTRFDRIFLMRRNGIYNVCDAPEKLFVDQGLVYVNYAEKEIINQVLFTVIYKDPKSNQAFIKRFSVPSWTMNKDYAVAPEGMEILHIDTRSEFEFTLNYIKKPRIKALEETFSSKDWEIRGHKALGIKLSLREVESIQVKASEQQELF